MQNKKELEFKKAKEQLNEGKVRDILKNTMKKVAMNQYAQNNFKPSKIPDEKIDQAFMIIDTHTKILDNLNIINNYNLTVQVISSLMLQEQDWYISEERCVEIISNYLDVYIDYSMINNETDKEKLLRDNIKKYIIYSCLTYLAVYKKDKELLSSYNKKITEAVKIILQEINTQINRPKYNEAELKDQVQEIPKEVLQELERKD